MDLTRPAPQPQRANAKETKRRLTTENTEATEMQLLFSVFSTGKTNREMGVMKTAARGFISTAACLLFASVIHTFAIEGLKISVQCSNVVLSWPSVDGRVQMISIAGTNTCRESPKVDVHPPVLESHAGRVPKDEGRKVGRPTTHFAEAFLEAILPQISDFVVQIGLPMSVPLTTNQVDMSQYVCVIDQDRPTAQIFLKNGDRFNYRHGCVVGFYAHDAFFKFPKFGRTEDFLGKINMNTNEAIELTGEILRKLGYAEKTAVVAVSAPISQSAQMNSHDISSIGHTRTMLPIRPLLKLTWKTRR